jgi:hypothetical protein
MGINPARNVYTSIFHFVNGLLQCFTTIFIKEPNKDVNPDEVVSMGALRKFLE